MTTLTSSSDIHSPSQAAESRPPARIVLSGYYGFHNLGDEAILDEQMSRPGSLLGEILIEKALVSAADIQNILKLQLNELMLGQILVRTKTISQEQLDIALLEQENTGELLGSVLIGFGFCTPEQINWALDLQSQE